MCQLFNLCDYVRALPFKAGSQYDARPCVALRRHTLTLAATHPNASIDSNPTPAFPHVAFTRQVEKNSLQLGIFATRKI